MGKIRKVKNHEQSSNVSDTLRDPYDTNRGFRITVAVAGTVLDNAVGPIQKTFLAGQIARAISIFNVDEILIFNDKGKPSESEGCCLLELLLRHAECPPYLKRELFPLESKLQYAGLIPPLCLPNHFTKTDIVPYREGISTKEGGVIEVGLSRKVNCGIKIPEGIRVTVKIDNPESKKGIFKGEIVAPNEPSIKTGVYWGYKVEVVSSLIQILRNPKYDCIIGTSDRGQPVSELSVLNYGCRFQNLLVVFGGVDGLESAIGFENDSEDDFLRRFKHYINVRPCQGTKTIRTEEAIPLTFAALEGVLRNTFCVTAPKSKK